MTQVTDTKYHSGQNLGSSGLFWANWFAVWLDDDDDV